MTEHPILFNREMIRALHSGRKTQTRRMVTPMRGMQSEWLTVEGINRSPRLYTCHTNPDRRFGAQMDHPRGGPLGWVQCPYGEPGDRLWVREAWRVSHKHDHLAPRDLPFDRGMTIMYGAGGSRAHNAAGEYVNDRNYPPTLPAWAGKGRPSIHMPRAASRTDLEVTGVRVERLQDITEADAEAEGVDFLRHVPDADETLSARDLYRILWDSINEARGYGWKSNPWVWVVDFPSAL
jgi:hypothetical protein